MVPVVVHSAPVTSTHGGGDCHLCLVQGREGEGEGRDGSAQSSREVKVSKGGSISAARALMDALSGRRGKEKA